MLAQKSNPEDQDYCFRALAVAFDLSKDEWLRLFAPCCFLLPRNLRLQETGCSPAGILQDRERNEEQINGGRKQKKGWWLPQRMTGSGLFSPFWGIALGIGGYRPGYRSEALNPSFLPVLEPSISTAWVAVRNPVRQRTKGVEETKRGSKKGERERRWMTKK